MRILKEPEKYRAMLYGAAYANAMAEQPWHGARARGSATECNRRFVQTFDCSWPENQNR